MTIKRQDATSKQLVQVLVHVVNLFTELAEPCYGKRWVKKTADELEVEYEKFRQMVHNGHKGKRTA
jgi:hypothetical protein